jgi:hypothetical protein
MAAAFCATASPPTGQSFTFALPETMASAKASQPANPHAPQFAREEFLVFWVFFHPP